MVRIIGNPTSYSPSLSTELEQVDIASDGDNGGGATAVDFLSKLLKVEEDEATTVFPPLISEYSKAFVPPSLSLRDNVEIALIKTLLKATGGRQNEENVLLLFSSCQLRLQKRWTRIKELCYVVQFICIRLHKLSISLIASMLDSSKDHEEQSEQ
uniref:Uncharacterized protein n=1 Tax=Glossina austeni TaxID=7395 RepID=A0A1A9VUG7_GLOAU